MLIYKYKYLVQILNKRVSQQQNMIDLSSQDKEGIPTIQGLNFEGQIKLTNDVLRLDITQFKRGKLFFAEINNKTLEENIPNYLIYSKTIDLYNELIKNKSIQINDEGSMIVPIEIYKDKWFPFIIRIPLQNAKFSNEEQEKHKLYDEIARIYKQKISLQNKMACVKNPKINFLGHDSDPDYKSFQITKNGKQVKMMAKNIWKFYNHSQNLPNLGVYYVKFIILVTASKKIRIGVCGQNIQKDQQSYQGRNFIGLDIYEASIYANKTFKFVITSKPIILTTSVFRLEIDMNKKILTWYVDDKEWCEEKLNQNIQIKKIRPTVVLYSKGDTILFID